MPSSFIEKLTLAAALVVCASSVRAETVLNDWCLNINADTTSACNPVPATSLPAIVNGSGFDFTLNSPPGTPNRLGSLTITLGPGNGQSVLAYMDYDLNFASSGSFQDVGSVHGTPPPGVTYELDDPSGNIFGDFAGNALRNVNSVATGSPPPGPCCDVSWALAVGVPEVPAGGEARVTFAVLTTQPKSGFYLEQSNIQSGEAIYLTETVSTVPLPNALVLLGSGLGGLLLTAAQGLSRQARSRLSAVHVKRHG